MKKFLFALLLFASFAVSAQKYTYKPYTSLGSSLSAGTFAYSAEVGVYNDNTWYSVALSQYRFEGKTYQYASVRSYYKLATSGIATTFATASANVMLDKSKQLSFEPGVATVFNITKKFAPQVSLSLPTYEGSALFKPTNVSFGFGVNYWIK